MMWWPPLTVLVFYLAAVGENILMIDDTREILETSKDQRALVNAALTLARSADAGDHARLVHALGSDSFLRRLDTHEQIHDLRHRTRVERVVEALVDNPSVSAHEGLISLTSSATFLKEPRRVDSLIRASAKIRPPPKTLVAFWDKYSRPDDGYTNLTVRSLVENGTPPALALFERKMLDSKHSDDDKIEWLHADVLPHRNDEPLLEASERLIVGTLTLTLKLQLIDAIFDYRPDEWYSEAMVYKPPDRSIASDNARGTLRRIGEYALRNLTLSARQIKVIEAATGLDHKKLHKP